jgi:hypothetical protein
MGSVAEKDSSMESASDMKPVTRKPPSPEEVEDSGVCK